MSRPAPSRRARFRAFQPVTLRWNDNDPYGHLNNAIHYQLFDTAVNAWLIENGLLARDLSGSVFLVVSTSCDYFDQVGFPDPVEIGLAVENLGSSSVRYRLGLLRRGGAQTLAEGHFTHVLVDGKTRRPIPIPEQSRARLQGLMRND